MSIELAEKLKTKLTDQWVVVDGSVPELKRFSQWTGKVKTVNMNGRALVEFDGPVDISWYDIDPAYLTVVDGPRPKKAVEHAPKAAAPAKSAAAAPAGVSPLQAARAQGAAAPAAGKPSPLDMIRKQGAAKKEAEANAAAPAAAVEEAAPVEESAPVAKPAPVATTGADGKKLSPLEMIRKQGAAKRD